MKIIRTKTALAVVAVLGVVACGDDPFQVIEETEFAASLGIDLVVMEQLPTGVYIQDVELGTGTEAQVGNQVVVDYTGWLADGSQFDTGDDAQFALVTGPGGVIRGFRDGIVGMQVGGTRKIIVPPEEGYGPNPPRGIPVGAILVFEVTLVEVVTP